MRCSSKDTPKYHTRKFSCGKPQEAYCQHHNLSKHNLSWKGDPIPARGLSIPGWGVPHPDLARGVPLSCGTTPSWPGRGYPIPGWGCTPVIGYPLSWPSWGYPIMGYPYPDYGPVTGVYSRKDLGPVEVLCNGDGVPPERTWNEWKYYGMEMGYPLPRCEQTENITPRHTSYAGGNKRCNQCWYIKWHQYGILRKQIPINDCRLK